MNKELDTRTFYKLGIVLGIVTLTFDIIGWPVEGIVVGAIALIVNIRARKEYRIKLGVLLTVVGLIGNIGFLMFLIISEMQKLGSSDYWFCRLIF